jgi:hypothetical protein
MMQTTNHPASPHDTALIADMQSIGASGHADAGQVLAEILLDQGAAPPSPSFATLPWRADGVTGRQRPALVARSGLRAFKLLM